MAVLIRAKPVTERLDLCIAYAANPEKTGLKKALEYAVNPEKTERYLFVSCLNCTDIESAYDEMQATKELYHKTGGRLAYSFIQSFAEGEVTPEQAHLIGMRLAAEYFGDRFQVVVGTHLNTDNLHNHIVINSVDLDGNKYRDKLASLDELRELSDRLCKEYDLSIVKPLSRNSKLPYAEYAAKKSGDTTRNDVMRADIDEAISRATSFVHFTALLKSIGYKLKYGKNIKYMTITPPGGERARRIYQLGPDYSEEAIRRRIRERDRTETHDKPIPKPQPKPLPRLRRGRLSRKKQKPIKLTGMQARYFRIMYLLGWIRKHPRANREVFFMRYQELRKIDSYAERFRYCHSRGISTIEQMRSNIAALQQQTNALTERRREIYALRRKADAPVMQAELTEINQKLKPLRKELRLCIAILDENIDLERKQREEREKQRPEKGGKER